MLARAVACVGLMLGCVLLTLAIPRLAANLALLPANSVIDEIEAGVLPPPAAYERALAGSRRALEWTETPDILADVGLIYYSLAVAADRDHAHYDTVLDRAEGVLNRALAANPAHSHGWAQLAFVRGVAGDAAGAAQAVLNSMLSGPFQPELIAPRTGIALANLDAVDASRRPLLFDELRLAAHRDLVRLARTIDLADAEPLAEEALAIAPAQPPKLRRVRPTDLIDAQRLWTIP